MSSIVILVLSFALWALLHSLTASLFGKRWARRRFGAAADRWYRLAYNLFAGLSFLPVLVLILLLPDRTLYTVPGPAGWLLRAGQVLALVGLAMAFRQTDPGHFLGLAQLTGAPESGQGSLIVRGLYCRVRHPLYLFSMLLIWLTPSMTANWLVACVLFTAYFYLGSLHEEQRLLAEFGDAYARYQQQVPMLIPRPGRCVPPS